MWGPGSQVKTHKIQKGMRIAGKQGALSWSVKDFALGLKGPREAVYAFWYLKVCVAAT